MENENDLAVDNITSTYSISNHMQTFPDLHKSILTKHILKQETIIKVACMI